MIGWSSAITSAVIVRAQVIARRGLAGGEKREGHGEQLPAPICDRHRNLLVRDKNAGNASATIPRRECGALSRVASCRTAFRAGTDRAAGRVP
jgi:hypothetical protein